MRKVFFMLSLLLFNSLIHAQLDTFNLSTYKLPDIKRHQLDLSFDLNGTSFNRDSYQRLNSDYFTEGNNIRGSFGLGYGFYRNSKSYQGDQLYSIGLNSSFSDQKNDDKLVHESLNIEGNVQINSYNRFYFDDKLFFETDLLLFGRYSNKDVNYSTLDNNTENRDLNISIPIGIGSGRIETIQDAWLAIYILDELKENGKLTRNPSNEEILEFSSIISQLKNERFFDARLQKMKEIEEVDKFLQSKGLILEPDSRYFTVVNDNWDNAAINVRKSGKRISFILDPGYRSNYSLNKQTDEFSNFVSENQRIEYTIGLKMRFDYEKPINLKWQSSFSVSISGNYFQGIDEDIDDNSKSEISSPQLKFEVYNRLGYYPNSRTDLGMRIGLRFNNYFGTEDVENTERDINHLEISPYLQLTMNYYISPKLLLDVNYSIQYYYIESNSEYFRNVMYGDFIKEKQFYQYINIGFIYKFF